MATKSAAAENDTVIKRVLPYLRRRGYDEATDMEFEVSVALPGGRAGRIDILFKPNGGAPKFLLEAKRFSHKLTARDVKQALEYGEAMKSAFVVLTNGHVVRCYNTVTGDEIEWDGAAAGVIPQAGAQLDAVLSYLRKHPNASTVPLADGTSNPYRPGLPLRQLNALFARCHNMIRNIEKQEDHAFADFSKLLFLKLLEERADFERTPLPYSYRFWKLADTAPADADQAKNAVEAMLAQQRSAYGDVLADPLRLNKPKTFLSIVKALAEVSFNDSEADVKGAAFEYFVRATLKGKNLGQYFTPRPLVELMVAIVGREKVFNAVRAGEPVNVIDPACGTGGFLVFMLRDALAQVAELYASGVINAATRDRLIETLKQQVFHGSDANEGVASAAKMNMIVAGDGHSNITAEDTLRKHASVWQRDIDLVMTNPPFGTSEANSMTDEDLAEYPIATTKGQLLFLQRMVKETKSEGLICTVIDEGVLNTDTATDIRKFIIEHTRLRAVVRLPPETFKPNKINVRSDVLLLEKRKEPDANLAEDYPVKFVDLTSLGYDGAGISLRGFEFATLTTELSTFLHSRAATGSGAAWSGFSISSRDIARDAKHRFDLKYWEPSLRGRIAAAQASGARTIEQINTITTARGVSPKAELYVDESDGHARVLKAGSSIDGFGRVVPVGPDADFIQREDYDKLNKRARVQRGDVLLSSTGDGTLGKAAVYNDELRAVADGHITIIRVNPKRVSPEYLADYLRTGFGQQQVHRLYTGATGLIELTPQHVDAVLVELPSLDVQRARSRALRDAEGAFENAQRRTSQELADALTAFRQSAM
jgi:type I restriction enzyme M protein